MAAGILGGHEALAQFLGAPIENVTSWAAGESEPPLEFLVRIVELIEQRTVSAARTATAGRSRRDEAK